MANISRNSFNETKNYDKVIQQQGMPFTDYDYNELQDIMRTKMRRAIQDMFSDCAINSSGQLTPTSPASMTLSVASGTLYVGGYRVNLPASSVAVNTAPTSGTRTDVVYLHVHEVEIDSTQDPNIKASVLTIEPTRRIQVVADVVYVANSSTVPASSESTKDFYFGLGTIAVGTNVTTIVAGNITDTRTIKSQTYGSNQTIQANLTVTGTFVAQGATTTVQQLILGGTDSVSSPKSAVYLAPPNTQAVGMDQFGNLLPIQPTAVTGGAGWTVSDKAGNSVLSVLIDGTKVLKSANSTLDDGAGNAVIKGKLTVQSTGSTFTGSLATTKSTLDDGNGNLISGAGITANGTIKYGVGTTLGLLSYGGSVVTLEASSTNTSIQIKPSGTGTLQLNPLLATAVTTKNNTLDDGSGNTTFTGKMTVSGGAGRVAFSSVDGSNNLWFGTGSTEPGSLAFGWKTNGSGAVTSIQLGATSNPSVVTNNSTLDDGAGNANFKGNITGTTGSFSGKVAKVSGLGTGGHFGVGTVLADASDSQITVTTATDVISFTPPVQGNYLLLLSYRVANASTNVDIKVSYTDGSGTVQTDNPVSSSSEAIGTYNVLPVYINATTGGPVKVTVTAGVANNLFVSATALAM